VLNATPLPVTIVEPHLTLAVSHIYTKGYDAEIVYTLTNNGNT
jgi:hypothetical protein